MRAESTFPIIGSASLRQTLGRIAPNLVHQGINFANTAGRNHPYGSLYTVGYGLIVICRLYIPDDFAKLYQIEEDCFSPLFRFSRRTMRYLVQKLNAAVWIAEEAGRMAGFAIVEWKQTRNDVTAYIQTIKVAPEARCQGVGGQLLRCAEASARAAGAVLLQLHVDEENQVAIRLYQANGFLCAGRIEDYYPQGRAALLYTKRLQDGAGEPDQKNNLRASSISQASS